MMRARILLAGLWCLLPAIAWGSPPPALNPNDVRPGFNVSPQPTVSYVLPAGTGQSSAAALSYTTNLVASCPSGTGVILVDKSPLPVAVANECGAALSVYPPSGQAITVIGGTTLGPNAPASVAAASEATFYQDPTGGWTEQLVAVGASGGVTQAQLNAVSAQEASDFASAEKLADKGIASGYEGLDGSKYLGSPTSINAGTVNLSSPGPDNGDVWVSHTLTGTVSGASPNGFAGPVAYQYFDTANDGGLGSGILIGAFIDRLNSGWCCQRTGASGIIFDNAAVPAGSVGNLVGMFGQVTVNASLGGTAGSSYTNYAGSAFGGNPQVIIKSGATNVGFASGMEIDEAIQSPSVGDSYGLNITHTAGNQYQGVFNDAALKFGSQNGALDPGWDTLMLLAGSDSAWPGNATGYIMRAKSRLYGLPPGYTNDRIQGWGIDLSGVTFIFDPFKSTGWSVDALGDSTALTYTTTNEPSTGANNHQVPDTAWVNTAIANALASLGSGYTLPNASTGAIGGVRLTASAAGITGPPTLGSLGYQDIGNAYDVSNATFTVNNQPYPLNFLTLEGGQLQLAAFRAPTDAGYIAANNPAGDWSRAWSRAITVANAFWVQGGSRTTGMHVKLVLPAGNLNYGTDLGAALPDILCPLFVSGQGEGVTTLVINNQVATGTGALFTYVGSNAYGSDLQNGSGPVTNPFIDAEISQLTVQSNHTGATHAVNLWAFVGYWRIVHIEDVDVYSDPGIVLQTGVLPSGYTATYGLTNSQIHEMVMGHFRVNDSGDGAFQAAGTPGTAVLLAATGNGSTAGPISDDYRCDGDIRIFQPHGYGIRLRGIANGGVSGFDCHNMVMEGSITTTGGVYIGALLEIGDAGDNGVVNNVHVAGRFVNPYPGYESVLVSQPTAVSPNKIVIDGDFEANNPIAHDVSLQFAGSAKVIFQAASPSAVGEENIEIGPNVQGLYVDEGGTNPTYGGSSTVPITRPLTQQFTVATAANRGALTGITSIGFVGPDGIATASLGIDSVAKAAPVVHTVISQSGGLLLWQLDNSTGVVPGMTVGRPGFTLSSQITVVACSGCAANQIKVSGTQTLPANTSVDFYANTGADLITQAYDDGGSGPIGTMSTLSRQGVSTLPALAPYTYAQVSALTGMQQYSQVGCKDCLKPGETAGSGTGMTETYIGSGWYSTAGTAMAH